jgi:hypothetical protein
MNRANTRHSNQLSVFIDKVMEPLPDAVLIDGRFRRELRDERLRVWRRAEARMRYFAALVELAELTDPERCSRVADGPIQVPGGRWAYLPQYRQAIADLLLTPVNYTYDVAWKRRQKLDNLPVSKAAVGAAIEADERFLAAHRPRRGPKP